MRAASRRVPCSPAGVGVLVAAHHAVCLPPSCTPPSHTHALPQVGRRPSEKDASLAMAHGLLDPPTLPATLDPPLNPSSKGTTGGRVGQWVYGTPEGVRGMRQVTHHLLASQRMREAVALLTDPHFVEAGAEAGLLFDILDALQWVVEKLRCGALALALQSSPPPPPRAVVSAPFNCCFVGRARCARGFVCTRAPLPPLRRPCAARVHPHVCPRGRAAWWRTSAPPSWAPRRPSPAVPARGTTAAQAAGRCCGGWAAWRARGPCWMSCWSLPPPPSP
jgi:hypothetical protein